MSPGARREGESWGYLSGTLMAVPATTDKQVCAPFRSLTAGVKLILLPWQRCLNRNVHARAPGPISET